MTCESHVCVSCVKLKQIGSDLVTSNNKQLDELQTKLLRSRRSILERVDYLEVHI